jgi:hypothetical protein
MSHISSAIETALITAGGFRCRHDGRIYLDCPHLYCHPRCGVIAGSDNDGWFVGCDPYCEWTYSTFLNLLSPIETFADRARLLPHLVLIIVPRDRCILHHKSDAKYIRACKRLVCCSDCRQRHQTESAQLTHHYLLVGHMGLPRELARYIIWLATQV